MKKEEFLRRLEMLLSDISEEERAEAMAFYRSYFEDAGEGNEAYILEELGSPESVAEIIKRDLGMVAIANTGKTNESRANEPHVNSSCKEKKSNTTLILLIIIAVLTCPLWLGIVTGLFGTIIGLSAALIGCTVAVFMMGMALVWVGIVMLANISVAAGMAFTGSGLIVLAMALLLINACVWIFGKFFPWAVNRIVLLCKKTFKKDKEA